MKPMVIVVVMFVTVSVVGIASMQVQYAEAPAHTDSPSYVPFPSAESLGSNAALTAQPDFATASVVPFQESVVPPSKPTVAIPEVLRLVSFTNRRAGSTDDQEKWTWRAEVENQSPQQQLCHVEIEWLDRTGACLDSATELRRLEPGTHSISMVRAMDWEIADQATTVRVTALEVRPPQNDE